jgi:hypothetical protein
MATMLPELRKGTSKEQPGGSAALHLRLEMGVNEMSFLVKRRWADARSMMGELLVDSFHTCYTLEPPQKTDGTKPRAIPAGSYDLTIRHSPRFNRLMPHVENVPDFDGVLIHWGNFPKDTEGCTLVGTIRGTDFVGHSREEFDIIFRKIQDALATGPQTITYLDPEPFVMHPDVEGTSGEITS